MTGLIFKTSSTLTNNTYADKLFCLDIDNPDVLHGACVRKIRIYSDNNKWLKSLVVITFQTKNKTKTHSDYISIPKSQYQQGVLDYSVPLELGDIDNINWKIFVAIPDLTKIRYDIFLSHATI